MGKIVLYGNFTPSMRYALYDKCPKDFELYESGTENTNALSDADYIVSRGVVVDHAVLDAAKKLKMLQKWGSGYDKIDVAYAGQRGIPVAVCLGGNSIPVAELTVALMLDVIRNIMPLAERLKECGSWNKDLYMKRSFLLHGKTVGLIGMGNIAKNVAHIVQRGFDANVIYYDVVRLDKDAEKNLNIQYIPLQGLMREADIVSIHVPLLDSTRGMINSKMLECMKPSAYLINTSRGGVINEDDLIAALQEGKIMGAGLDTFSEEPLPADSPLLHMDNVIATPHIGGNTVDNDERMAAICMENISYFSQTGDFSMPAFVNKEFFCSL